MEMTKDKENDNSFLKNNLHALFVPCPSLAEYNALGFSTCLLILNLRFQSTLLHNGRT